MGKFSSAIHDVRYRLSWGLLIQAIETRERALIPCRWEQIGSKHLTSSQMRTRSPHVQGVGIRTPNRAPRQSHLLVANAPLWKGKVRWPARMARRAQKVGNDSGCAVHPAGSDDLKRGSPGIAMPADPDGVTAPQGSLSPIRAAFGIHGTRRGRWHQSGHRGQRLRSPDRPCVHREVPNRRPARRTR